MYDTIVVGAGPAGSTAAKVLAERGLRVLLVERAKLPRNKSCSGILIGKTLERIERIYEEGVPRAVMCTPVDNRGMVLTANEGKEYRFEQPGVNVWRSDFDHWLTRKAVERGAALMENTAVVSCRQDGDGVEVTVSGDRAHALRAAYVVDCAGAASVLTRQEEKAAPIVTFQTFFRGNIDLDPHYFYAYLQPALSEYDAWFNVKDELLVLGVAVKNAREIEAYFHRFVAYMTERHGMHVDAAVRQEKWIMPHVRPGCSVRHGEGRLLSAGEAAGFLNPMGEGISSAVESGRIAAESIALHFGDSSAVLDEYRERTQPLVEYMRRQWDLVSRLSSTFSHMRV